MRICAHPLSLLWKYSWTRLGCVIIKKMKIKEEYLHSLFWDTDLSKLDIEKNKQYIIERILELGDRNAVRWLFSNISSEEIRNTLKKSKIISKKV